MPQMKPMNWINLFMMMNLIIMMMNIKNYYVKNNLNPNNINKAKNLKKSIWQW